MTRHIAPRSASETGWSEAALRVTERTISSHREYTSGAMAEALLSTLTRIEEPKPLPEPCKPYDYSAFHTEGDFGPVPEGMTVPKWGDYSG